jgi:hypothetical protein
LHDKLPKDNPLSILFLPLHWTVMIEWLRLECSFISWDPTALFFCPRRIKSSTWSIDVIYTREHIYVWIYVYEWSLW